MKDLTLKLSQTLRDATHLCTALEGGRHQVTELLHESGDPALLHAFDSISGWITRLNSEMLKQENSPVFSNGNRLTDSSAALLTAHERPDGVATMSRHVSDELLVEANEQGNRTRCVDEADVENRQSQELPTLQRKVEVAETEAGGCVVHDLLPSSHKRCRSAALEHDGARLEGVKLMQDEEGWGGRDRERCMGEVAGSNVVLSGVSVGSTLGGGREVTCRERLVTRSNMVEALCRRRLALQLQLTEARSRLSAEMGESRIVTADLAAASCSY